MKKKEVNINEESTSAGGAHAVNKFRISDFVMMAVIVILCASCVLPFLHVAVKSISGNTAVMSKSVLLLAQRHHLRCLQEGICR